MSLIVREVRPVDYDSLIELIHTTTLASYQAFYPREAIEYFIAYHDPAHVIADIEAGYCAAVLLSGTLVATGARLDRNIRRVFVHPEHQHCGLGRLIMQHLESQALAQGYDWVELNASLPAYRFYLSLGYTDLGFCQIGVGNGLSLDYHRMARVLHPRPEAGIPVYPDGPSYLTVPGHPQSPFRLEFCSSKNLLLGRAAGPWIREGTAVGCLKEGLLQLTWEITLQDGSQVLGSADFQPHTEDGSIRYLADPGLTLCPEQSHV